MDDKNLKAKNIEQIAIFGSAHSGDDSELSKEVFKVSKLLAETGYISIKCKGKDNNKKE